MSSSTPNESSKGGHGASHDNLLFSGIGVVLVAVILVIVNLLFANSSAKVDATEHKIHTLTEGTKAILEGLDDKLKKYDSEGERARLEVRLYATRDKDIMPPEFEDYANQVELLLREMEGHAGDRISLEVIDPEPYSAEERSARENGVRPIVIDQDTGAQIYLGVAVSSLEKTTQESFLNPRNNQLLEYTLIRTISEAADSDKPKLGLMSSYPLAGGPPAGGFNPQASQPWVFYSLLVRDYDVQDVPMTVDKIDPDLDVLLVVHPAGLSEKAQFAIDQYLLGGGKVMAMLDAYSLANHAASNRQPQVPGMPPQSQPTSSDMPELLKAWGLQFESVNVVGDRGYMNRDPRRRLPVFIGVPGEAIDDDHVATKDIEYLEMELAGAFYGDGASGLDYKVLVRSSENVGTLSPHGLFVSQEEQRAAINNMESSSGTLALAVSLSGRFKTAFPDGPPADDEEDGGAEDEADEAEGEEDGDEEWLEEAQADGQVILVADTDMITDGNAPQQIRFQGHTFQTQPPNGNIAFVSNLLDYLAGDTNLFKVRSRGDTTRPFTKYQKLVEELTGEEKKELTELLETRQENQRRYDDIAAKYRRGEELSEEEVRFLRNYDEDEADERRKTEDRIIELRHQLNQRVEGIEAKWKWLNIALVPAIVALAAIAHLLVRRARTSAR